MAVIVLEGVAVVSTVKQDVEALLHRLPDDCSLEDVQYHLYILEKMRRGLEDAEAGRVATQEEVEARFAEWLIE
jgi:predicted transcriptional regulator